MPPLCAPVAPAWSRERHQIAKLLGAFTRHGGAEKSMRYFVVILIEYFADADREQMEPCNSPSSPSGPAPAALK
jgi:hypothetical protein